MMDMRLAELKKDRETTQAVVCGLANRLDAVVVQIKGLQEQANRNWEGVQSQLTAIKNAMQDERDGNYDQEQLNLRIGNFIVRSKMKLTPAKVDRRSSYPKPKFPAFEGVNVDDWIYRSELYFELEQVEEVKKVRLAAVHMYGNALQWHFTFLRNRGRGGMPMWTEYVDALTKRFGKAVGDDPMGLLKTTSSEMYCCSTMESLQISDEKGEQIDKSYTKQCTATIKPPSEAKGSESYINSSLKNADAKKLSRSVTWAEGKINPAGTRNLHHIKEREENEEHPILFGVDQIQDGEHLVRWLSTEAGVVAWSKDAEVVASASETRFIVLLWPPVLNKGVNREGFLQVTVRNGERVTKDPGITVIGKEAATIFKEPESLPHNSSYDHSIELREGVQGIGVRPYKHSTNQEDAIRIEFLRTSLGVLRDHTSYGYPPPIHVSYMDRDKVVVAYRGFRRRHRRKLFIVLGIWRNGYCANKLDDARRKKLMELEREIANEKGNEAMEDGNVSDLMEANECFPDTGDGARWKSFLERLQHRQINRIKQVFPTVGTPYCIAPEVVRKKGFGMECDWGLLGIIMYEMLAGDFPFLADDPIRTCRKIIQWKNHLKILEESRLPPEANDLIFRLPCDVEHLWGTRGAVQIKAHPWFKDVERDKPYEMEDASKLEVNGKLDTQHLMKSDEVELPIHSQTGFGPSRKMLLTPKDFNFVRYTYKGSNKLLATAQAELLACLQFLPKVLQKFLWNTLVLITPDDIVDGFLNLNLVFMVQIFHQGNDLSTDGKKMSLVERSTNDVQTSREEVCFRPWNNNLDIGSYGNNVFEEARKGWVLLEVLDKVLPETVTWKLASKSHIKLASKHQQDKEIGVGDWVIVKLQPYEQTSAAQQLNQELAPLFYGPNKNLDESGAACREDRKPMAILHKKMVKHGNRAASKDLIQWSNTNKEDATWEFLYDLKQKYSQCTLEDKYYLKERDLMQGRKGNSTSRQEKDGRPSISNPKTFLVRTEGRSHTA